jgi:hypothetical protein
VHARHGERHPRVTAYNPLFAGTLYPDFKRLTFQNIHHVSCMSTQQPVVTIEGFNALHRTGPVTLDNVVVDNSGPATVAAEHVDITMGPRASNFTLAGPGVVVTDAVTEPASPRRACSRRCRWPRKPAGWFH